MSSNIGVCRVQLYNLLPFPAIATVAHQYSHTAGMLFISQAGPANGVRVIKVIILVAVGVSFAGVQKRVDQEPMRWHRDMVKISVFPFVIVLGSVVVRVEDAGIPFLQQQD